MGYFDETFETLIDARDISLAREQQVPGGKFDPLPIGPECAKKLPSEALISSLNFDINKVITDAK